MGGETVLNDLADAADADMMLLIREWLLEPRICLIEAASMMNLRDAIRSTTNTKNGFYI